MATETKSGFLTDPRVDEIVKQYSLSEKVGEIRVGLSAFPEQAKQAFVNGWCREAPKLINRIDEQLWVKEWENRASIYGVEFHLTDTSLFSERTARFNSGHMENRDKNKLPEYAEIEKMVQDISHLITMHYEAACSYNRNVADPYIEERQKTISNLRIQ